jgi:hypothetical protein
MLYLPCVKAQVTHIDADIKRDIRLQTILSFLPRPDSTMGAWINAELRRNINCQIKL